jgi:RHS repeat-associated protein
VGGLYDFLFREYSMQGRWPSPDPAGLAAVDLSDPQSLDRYAYVLNDPLNLIDPLGLRVPGRGSLVLCPTNI